MSIRASTRVTGVRELEKHFRGATRLVKAHTRKRFHYWGRRIITEVRKGNVFKYRMGGASGALMRSLWTKQGESRGGFVVQRIGWGVAHGEVLEWGPKFRHMWTIKPRGMRTFGTTTGGSKGKSYRPIAFLRFKVLQTYTVSRGKNKGAQRSRGMVVYAQQVEHWWSATEKRPHFKPAIDHLRPEIVRDISTIAPRVLSGELT